MRTLIWSLMILTFLVLFHSFYPQNLEGAWVSKQGDSLIFFEGSVWFEESGEKVQFGTYEDQGGLLRVRGLPFFGSSGEVPLRVKFDRLEIGSGKERHLFYRQDRG